MGDINLKSVFGNNNRSQIRNKIQCNKIIQNSLQQLVGEYFSGTTIDEKFIQGVHDDTKEFEVFFGRAKAFTSPNSEYTNFQELITKFYQEIFEDAGIPDRINKICTIDDVYTIAITSRDESTPGNRNTKLHHDSIIASAFFLIQPKYVFLLLIGVSNKQHNQLTYSKNFGFGTFLLATIEEIEKCTIGSISPIFGQIPKLGEASAFYKKNLFSKVSLKNDTVKLIQKEQVVAVIEDKNKTMIWVKSSGPIIIVTGAWVSTYNTDLVIDEIFNKGKRIFLEIIQKPQ